MAQRMLVVMEDDLDGSKAVETIQFGLEGTAYEIDLSKKNAAAMRSAMAVYVEAGRRVAGKRVARSGGRVAGKSTPRAQNRDSNAEIRAWARDNGWPDLGERGRISAEIVEAYENRPK